MGEAESFQNYVHAFLYFSELNGFFVCRASDPTPAHMESASEALRAAALALSLLASLVALFALACEVAV